MVPQDAWREEFATAARLGIDYIELIAEIAHNPKIQFGATLASTRLSPSLMPMASRPLQRLRRRPQPSGWRRRS